MKVLLLPDNLYEYLQHVVRSHTGGGIDPEEGLAAYQLWQHVQQAQTVDVSKLGKAKLENLGPDGVSLRFEPNDVQDGAIDGPGADATYTDHKGDPTYPASGQR